MVPWSRQEFNWVMKQYLKRRLQTEKNQKLEAKYLSFKEQMARLGKKTPGNFNSMILLNEIFHTRYPNEIEAMAHFVRYDHIFKFLFKYRDALLKEGLLTGDGEDLGMKPQLMDSLCTLPYSLEQRKSSGSQSHTFLYAQVIKITKAKINAHLN